MKKSKDVGSREKYTKNKNFLLRTFARNKYLESKRKDKDIVEKYGQERVKVFVKNSHRKGAEPVLKEFTTSFA